jgi:transposase
VFATEGNDAATITAFADDLAAHGGDPDAISQVCIDMSPAFIKGIAENLPNAAITFDKFHAVKIINDAVDQVRRTEQKEQSLLRGTRYLWLRNPQTLSDRQRTTLGGLPTRHLESARAYQIRLTFQDLYDQPSVQAGASYLKKWYFWATHSRIEPVIAAGPRPMKMFWATVR